MKRLKNFVMLRSLAIALMLIVVVSQSFGQEESNPFAIEIGSTVGLTSINKSAVKYVTRDLNVNFTYDLNKRFALRLPMTLTTGLFDLKGLKSYEMNGLLGLGAGYNVVAEPTWRLQLAGEAGHTLSTGKSGDYFYYDLGGKLFLGKLTDRTNAMIGLGVRQTLRNKSLHDNFVMPYISVGFRLNTFKRR